MPKQSSVFLSTGKFNGISYYYSKNGGYQYRSINPNMSEVVKTDPRYVLTRRYASAFGFGAQMAAALLRAITFRWRFLFRGNMLAKLTKSYNYYFKQSFGLLPNVAVPWSSYKSSIMRDLNNQNKVQCPTWVTYFCDNYIMEMEDQAKISITRPWTVQRSQMDYLIEQGATGVRVDLYTLRVARLDLDPIGQHKYIMGASMSSLTVAHGDVGFDQHDSWTVLQASTPIIDGVLSPDIDIIGGIFVFVQPYKTVNSVKTTLQRLCTSYWFAPEIQQQ